MPSVYTVGLQVDCIQLSIAVTRLQDYGYYSNEANAVLNLGQYLRRWPKIELTLGKCTMFEREVFLPIKHKTFV